MISIANLALRQGKFALSGTSLTVPTGRYAVLMGKSGCGKTTILETIAGLRHPAAGTITLAGRDVTSLSPGARHIGYVPQDGALFPTLNVRGNLGFALEIKGETRKEINLRVNELAQWLEIENILDRKPGFLSGGEKQRVALGRALASRPPVLLLDEPLASLDDETRELLIEFLAKLRDTRNVTVLHVTHNKNEADRLGDVVMKLADGTISQTSLIGSTEV